MRDRGQFSIIAALLVAVVLISTVIITYSTIRNFPTGEQPKVLNAIDETNFALKQILGFTVGYYGSVLQVTGEKDYAYSLSYKYLVSGLNYIARTHPHWAASFDLTSLDLETYWFTRQSYSRGNITVKYDLTGLGVYGITYTTSCKLSVNILETEGNKAHIRVTADENDEPVINLGKSNFKFYLYKYANLTWVTTSPSTEPVALTDGKYAIEIPPEVDPYSYVVQVQDSRGIVTVASSYSRYICELTWGPLASTQQDDYVDQISNVDGVPDIGTHSNFTAMQHAPDGIFDTLTEATVGAQTTLIKSPSITTGTWANPTYACADDDKYAYVTSGTPSGTQTYSGYGFNIPSNVVINRVRVRYDAWSPHNIITFVGVGSKASGGTSAVSVPLPNNVAVGDICILVATTVPSATVSITNSGGGSWTALPGTPVDIAGGEKLYVWWRRHASGDSAPSVRASTDHVCAGIAAWRGCITTGSPIDVYQTGTESTSDTTFEFATTISTTVDGCMVIAICTSGEDRNNEQFSAWANAQLSSVTERIDYFTNDGGGGGFGLAEGYKAFAGAVGTWSAALDRASPKAYVSFALKPSVGDEQIRVDVSWDGGKSWSTKQATGLTGTETTYWYDVTSATSWTSEKLNDANFRVRVEAYTVGTAGQVRLDWISVEVTYTPSYQLDLEVQWVNVNYTNRFQYLCIKTGALGSENLRVDVYSGSSWVTVINSLQSNAWNNVSVASYINSPTFTIRFKGGNDFCDSVQDSWDIDAVLLSSQPSINFYSLLQNETFVVELLQNGTMRWLGQNLWLTTKALPIPPVPIKAIRVNQTINGVNREVPFQIEDWASDYRVPLGLASNASVFNNRNMIVFLVNPKVSKVTIWWNGSDTAKQTPYAYLNRYFNDDPPRNINDETGTLRNGKLTLDIDATGSGFAVKSRITRTGIEVTANFMRVNSEWSIYGSNPAYTIYNGTVRDIVHVEAEWSGDGAPNCYNFYSHIVLTLPANATYYTYQLRLIFLESSDRPRTINDLCLIKLSTAGTGFSALTENGTSNGYPIVSTESTLFYNMSNIWQHHWSQLSYQTRGFGIMFTDDNNKRLYLFDERAASKTGGLRVSSTEKAIELLPVKKTQITNFADALDISWYGAVVTFDGTTTTPIYKEVDDQPTGLWVFVEYPPTVTVTTES